VNKEMYRSERRDVQATVLPDEHVSIFVKKGTVTMLTMKKLVKLVLGSILLIGLMVLFSPAALAASHPQQPSACVANGAIIVNATGTITAGTTGTVSSGASMNCVKTISVTAKNKAGSVSAITFVFTQVNCGISGCVNVVLGSIRVAPGTTQYGTFSASPAGLSSTLTVTANADPGNGSDNFNVTVQAFTS
jgi:hypothetical protein